MNLTYSEREKQEANRSANNNSLENNNQIINHISEN